MSTSAVTNNTSAASGATNSKSNSTSTTDASDRFLKLLVTQMQNQDPLNPMDNAQVTSQMAQINTVTGIDKLNTTITGMSNSFTQMQMLQGASLVGHGVLLEGNQLHVDEASGQAVGGYQLSAAASQVRIEVLNSAGAVVDTINQSGMGAGRQGFSWKPDDANMSTSGLTFKVTATSNGKAVTATPLMSDLVNAVSTTDGSLNLELLHSGSTAYSKVKALS
jgi:flagellar basal-body rod modification protein FlgD